MADRLTKAQCALLAVHFASEAKLQELHTLCRHRSRDSLPAELVLRILLTYLPEVTPPAQYTSLVAELVSGHNADKAGSDTLDTSHVDDVSEATAERRFMKLVLKPLSPPSYPPEGSEDVLTRFVCHRAYSIDQETGLVSLIPDLVTPFLKESEYLRLWYISTVLPLLRLRVEYYPGLDLAQDLTVEAFEQIDGRHGTELLLSGAVTNGHEGAANGSGKTTIGKELRGLVGPWIYGHTGRKRRKLDGPTRAQEQGTNAQAIKAGALSSPARGWEQVFGWLAQRAVGDFSTTVNALEQWSGPVDVDLDNIVVPSDVYSREELEALQVRYAQAGIAACYAAEASTKMAITGAHSILAKLSQLLSFEPPPDLATSVDQLPKVDDFLSDIHKTDDESVLEVASLLQEQHPLTKPTLAAYMFLQMLVYSAYQLAGLGHDVSLVNITKLRIFSSAEEQMTLLRKILSHISQDSKRQEQLWVTDLGRIIWLWGWNFDGFGDGTDGAGVIGKIKRADLDRELVRALLSTGSYALVIRMYIQKGDKHQLSDAVLEQTILAEAMGCYDNASNGNRSRGSMKKCHEILTTFNPAFPNSEDFTRAIALVSATHSMSFYSLILQHGVPLKPVNIRATQDPLSLIEQILEQNPEDYTNLDDLMRIGRNLTTASPSKVRASISDSTDNKSSESALLTYAERRVIFMCISAALTAQDFDTAYSYLTNRLSPSSSLSISSGAPEPEADDISWRAAFLAGRFRSASTRSGPATLRRLEQRTELLSLALLLAPPSALTEILSVYRRTEEEVTALLAQEAQADAEADSSRAQSFAATSTTVPGGFDALGPQQGRTYGQPRRELGALRHADAPVGLFDLAHGAARALTKNAFPLRSASGASAASRGADAPPGQEQGEDEAWGWGEEGEKETGERVRRRDMVASAVTGGLASGIGWVLGATPVGEEQRRRSGR